MGGKGLANKNKGEGGGKKEESRDLIALTAADDEDKRHV